MRRFIALTALAFAACGDNDRLSDPIDMVYRVTVTELEDSCDDGSLAGPETAFVDARLHADGTVELVERSLWIPGPGAYPSIRVHGGVVDYDAQRASAYTEKVFPYHIGGTLTTEAMDLTLTEHWYRQPDFTDCVRIVRMRGAPRGFLDPADLDGIYEIDVAYYGEICGSDPLPSVPEGRQVLLLDADPRPDTLTLWIESYIGMNADLPGGDGRIDWDGPMTVSTIEGYVGTTGGLHGRFGPAEVDAELSFRLPGQAADCAYRYALTGAKRPSTATEPQGDYRVVFRVRDGCEGRTETRESHVTLVRQRADLMEVRDSFGLWFIPIDGDALSATDSGPGVVATFEGAATPPYLSYTVAFTYGEGADACTYAWDVDGVARYHPHEPWEPAFPPDPTRTAPDLDP